MAIEVVTTTVDGVVHAIETVATDVVVETAPSPEVVTITVESVVVDQSPSPEVIALQGQVDSIVETMTVVEVVEIAGRQGPPGPPGVAEEDMPYAEEVDFVDETTLYRGYAPVGTDTGDAGWRIKRITFAPDGDVSVKWAAGTADFVHIWDDRAGLAYP